MDRYSVPYVEDVDFTEGKSVSISGRFPDNSQRLAITLTGCRRIDQTEDVALHISMQLSANGSGKIGMNSRAFNYSSEKQSYPLNDLSRDFTIGIESRNRKFIVKLNSIEYEFATQNQVSVKCLLIQGDVKLDSVTVESPSSSGMALSSGVAVMGAAAALAAGIAYAFISTKNSRSSRH